jgi:hypothetical protein
MIDRDRPRGSRVRDVDGYEYIEVFEEVLTDLRI